MADEPKSAALVPADLHKRSMYEYWANVSEWFVQEAAALSLGLNPQEDHGNCHAYVNRLRLLERAVQAGKLNDGSGYPRSKFPPHVWSDFLKSKNLAFPTQLERRIRTAPTPKPKAQADSGRAKALEEEIKQLKDEISKLKEKNEKLTKMLNDPGRRKRLYLTAIAQLLLLKWPGIFEENIQGISAKANKIGMNHHSFRNVLKDVRDQLKFDDKLSSPSKN